MKSALWILLFVAQTSMAATIAVIDSGVDTEHKDLIPSIWMNDGETPNNNRDEDGNGYQDDVYGWNFAEGNNLVIDRSYLGTFSSDPYRFFEIQGKMFMGTATEEDIQWLRDKTQDPEVVKELQKFGNFVHGTHVAGITVENNPGSEILSVKLIPTEVKPFLEQKASDPEIPGPEVQDDGLRWKLLRGALSGLAGEQMKLLEEIAAYVGNHGSEIANGSFGTGYTQAKMITDLAFKAIFFRAPEAEESDKAAKFFLERVLLEGQKMVAVAPKTLFVFAAGNDGSNNDIYPTSPTNIDADNVISVAATYKYEFIAPFSNYGTKTVDVAAPGMLIRSQIPGNEYLDVSGTSQAAPMVANIAAQIKDINPKLLPKDIKAILMGTVDKKGFLSQKVKSAGIVNPNRATFAAKLSISTDVNSAISQANTSIQDVKSSTTKSFVNPNGIIPIPLTPQFKL